MPPKTERLELRLEAETVEQIDAWRIAQDDQPTRSEAIRRLVESGLEGQTLEGFRLNNRDKLMVWMLSEVMKNQIEQNRDAKNGKHELKTVKLIQEAIYGGHFWGLAWEMSGLFHDHVDDPKKVRLVVDILDAWSFIEYAYKRFTSEEKQRIVNEVGEEGNSPHFLGFDGNNETEYMSIAQFLVQDLHRFSCFENRDLNSHSPTVARYRRVAEAFEPIRKSLVGRSLNATEVIQLLKRQD